MTDNPTGPVHAESERWGGWTWREPHRGEHFRRCSYCGSIHPDDLAAEQAWRADWADRKYGWPHKFYVDLTNRDPDRQYVISAINFEPREGEQGWVPYSKLSRKQKKAMREDGWGQESYTYVRYSTRPKHHAKFYTVHLSDPDISAETIAAIERGSGLHFTFSDGRVGWQPVTTAGKDTYDRNGDFEAEQL